MFSDILRKEICKISELLPRRKTSRRILHNSGMSENIVIAGAGVIGLTIAHQLLLEVQEKKQRPPKQLCIIARNFPKDEPLTPEYTSPWAGAHYRPFPHRQEAFESDKRESAYTRVTHKFFERFALEHPESTIEFVKGIDFLEEPSDQYLNLGDGYSKESLIDFKTLSKDVLPNGVRLGCEYTTWCLNAPVYLRFLQLQIEQLCRRLEIPLKLERITLDSLQEITSLLPNVTTIFNATGTGLQYHGGIDSAVSKIRGQTVLLNVPNPNTIKYSKLTVTHQGKDGSWTFVIKRPAINGTAQYILGGTKQPGDTRVTPRESDTLALLEKARILYPDLMFPDGSFDIVRTNVGFRPARTGGSRLETQQEITQHGNLKIVHAYGLGGMGYETSVGVAKHSLKLFQAKTSKL